MPIGRSVLKKTTVKEKKLPKVKHGECELCGEKGDLTRTTKYTVHGREFYGWICVVCRNTFGFM